MSTPQKPYIGGQAVIEGVMMRAPRAMTVAVRRPDGSLAILAQPMNPPHTGPRLWRLPFLRGVAMLGSSMSMGYRALRFSAEQQMTAAEHASAAKNSAAVQGSLAISMLFAIGLFIALPQLLTAGFSKLTGVQLTLQSTAFHAVVGAFKLGIFTLYVWAISRIPEVRRVFQFHGAEHKTIYTYESELPLSVDNVRRQSTLHPRCGTTFLIVVIVVSIILGAIVTPVVLPHARGFVGHLQTFVLRLSLLPAIAGVSYELQRLSARFCTTGWRRMFLWPGFAFQKITTREPSDDQIEVAIAAMEAAKQLDDGAAGALATGKEHLFEYRSFEAWRAEGLRLGPAQA